MKPKSKAVVIRYLAYERQKLKKLGYSIELKNIEIKIKQLKAKPDAL